MTGQARSRTSLIIAVLLLATAGLVVIGTTIERTATSTETSPVQGSASTSAAAGPTTAPAEGGEGTAEHEAGEAPATSPTTQASAAQESGVGESATEQAAEGEPGARLETPLVLTAMVIVSVLLAGAVYWRPNRAVLAVIAAFTLSAAALDIAELIHQIGESRTGLALLVAVILLLRAATLIGTSRLWTATTQQPRQT